MRMRLHLTRAGGWWLIIVVVLASVFWFLAQRYLELPDEWAWLDWRKRRRRSWNLWDVIVFLGAIGLGAIVYWLGSILLRRLGIEVHAKSNED